MPKRSSSAEPGHDDVPELEDVVAVPATEPVPPPNLDLFADSGVDVAALREALARHLADEIDAALGALRTEFDAMLQRMETRVHARLPEILDELLQDAAGRKPR